MKKLLILTRFVNEYEPKRLAKEGRKAGFSVDLVKYGQISLSVDSKNWPIIDLGRKRKLADYGLIIPRSASKKGSSMVAVKTAILKAASDLGIKIVNGKSFLKYPLLGKIEQGLMLAKAGLPVAPMMTFGSKTGWKRFLKTNPKFPLMVKGRFGSHGRTVKLVKSKDQLLKLVQSYSAGNVLIQPVLPIKQWYRTIVCNGEYLGQMVHRQKQKFKIQSAGWRTKLKTLNSKHMNQLKDISLAAAKLFDCDFCGIDIGWNEETKSWVIFEVNRTAQFQYFEKRTKVNVAFSLICLLGC